MKKKSINEKLLEMDEIVVYKLVLDGTIPRFPKGFWNKESSRKCVKWLLEEKLKWNDEDIKNKLCSNTFKNNKLYTMLNNIYYGSPYEVINDTYPNRFKPWELKHSPLNTWNEENSKEAVKWLIEEKLKWNDEDIKNKLRHKTFLENGLNGMIHMLDNSPYKAINITYPNRFKPWELKSSPSKTWNKETSRKAIKWLIEEKLKWNDEDIKTKLSYKTFKDNKLEGVLNIMYNSSPYEIINDVYPNRFKPWELKRSPLNTWNKETSRKAIKWLIEEKLKWNDEDIKAKLRVKTFRDNKLGAMLSSVYNNSPYKAINDVYPNRFKKSDFRTRI